MEGNILEIQDTGKETTDGNVVYTQINSGNWITLSGTRISGEFTVQTTDWNGQIEDPNNVDQLTFQQNELSAVLSPRFQIKGHLDVTDTTKLSNLMQLNRSFGIKALRGGLGLIDAVPEAEGTSPKYIYILVKNITFSEVYSEATNYVAFTIQCEQIR